MAHKEQIQYCKSIRERFPAYFRNNRILDVGSLDINGNNRYLFPKEDNNFYLGLDVGAGKNVDIVSPVHKLSSKNKYDFIISTECFEHDKYYKDSLTKIVELLAPNGMFLFTCATTGRAEHGTTATSPADAPFTNDYYKNLTEKDIREVIDVESIFANYEFSVNEEHKDLQFFGIKK